MEVFVKITDLAISWSVSYGIYGHNSMVNYGMYLHLS